MDVLEDLSHVGPDLFVGVVEAVLDEGPFEGEEGLAGRVVEGG